MLDLRAEADVRISVNKSNPLPCKSFQRMGLVHERTSGPVAISRFPTNVILDDYGHAERTLTVRRNIHLAVVPSRDVRRGPGPVARVDSENEGDAPQSQSLSPSYPVPPKQAPKRNNLDNQERFAVNGWGEVSAASNFKSRRPDRVPRFNG